MNKIFFLSAVLFVFGCKNKETKNNELSPLFRKILIDYQMKYPSSNGDKYLYSASFLKKKQDTLLILSRGHEILELFKGFGVFEDKQLKPTYIYDNARFSNKFVLKRIYRDTMSYKCTNKVHIESHPPLYTYLIKNRELKLIKIDTFWRKW